MKKINSKNTCRIINDEGQVQEVSEVGVPGLFQPQACDIAEELHNNEALREYRQEMAESH